MKTWRLQLGTMQTFDDVYVEDDEFNDLGPPSLLVTPTMYRRTKPKTKRYKSASEICTPKRRKPKRTESSRPNKRRCTNADDCQEMQSSKEPADPSE